MREVVVAGREQRAIEATSLLTAREHNLDQVEEQLHIIDIFEDSVKFLPSNTVSGPTVSYYLNDLTSVVFVGFWLPRQQRRQCQLRGGRPCYQQGIQTSLWCCTVESSRWSFDRSFASRHPHYCPWASCSLGQTWDHCCHHSKILLG